jgi:hypothetical protein
MTCAIADRQLEGRRTEDDREPWSVSRYMRLGVGGMSEESRITCWEIYVPDIPGVLSI